ncbi:MAG TPA: hypothetical protein VHW23_30270 [Kofleriaceae bacterium]|jgi:hypothetical protein|nr:hypothetical protein [Kofleriaceae bacterium]
MMRRAIVLASAIRAIGCAHAPSGNAWGHYELTTIHDVDPPPTVERAGEPSRFSELVLAGVRLHALIGEHRWGYHAGIDLAAGSTLRAGGFAYDVALLPVGGGLRLGATSAIMAGVGVGAMGAVGTLDDALTLPVELVGEFGGGRARVLVRGRISYVEAAGERKRRTTRLPFGDEAEAMIGVRIGHHQDRWQIPTGNGYFGGLAYRELEGARFVGLTIGYSIDAATEYKRPLREFECTPACTRE